MLERGGRVSTMEWPDADTAWRAVSSVGPAVPALRSNDSTVLRDAVLAALEPCRDRRGGVPQSQRPSVRGGEEAVAMSHVDEGSQICGCRRRMASINAQVRRSD